MIKHHRILIALAIIGIAIIISGVFALRAETAKQEEQARILETTKVVKSNYPLYKIIKDVAIAPLEKGASGKIVLLTVDDGPTEYTRTIADILEKRNVKAIFFINGINNKKDNGAIRYVFDKGFQIGNHTWSHANLKKEKDFEKVKKEITNTSDLITNITGIRPQFFRPPYGEGTKEIKSFVASEQMLYLGWSSSSKDWEETSSNKEIFLKNISDSLRIGSVILIHEHKWSLAYLDDVITMIEEKGYTFADPNRIQIIETPVTPTTQMPASEAPKKVTQKSPEKCPKPAKPFEDETYANIGQTVALSKYNYMPSDLVRIPDSISLSANILCLRKEASEKLIEMISSAKKGKHIIKITSAFRNPEHQKNILDLNLKSKNQKTSTSVAKPGYSEHQLGTTIDLTGATIKYKSTATLFKDSPEYAWLSEHAYEYGFLESYPLGKEDITGYIFEPWHYRYIGIEKAKEAHDKNLTLTEYLEIIK